MTTIGEKRNNKNAFPAEKKVTMSYYITVVLNPGAAATTEHVFAANSIFDPDETNAGHQPTGYDQWALFYTRYTVLKSRIQVQAINTGSASEYVPPGVICLSLQPSSTAPATAHQAVELSWAKSFSLIGARSDSGYVNLKLNFNAKEYFGLGKPQDNPDVSALIGADPAAMPCFIISYGASVSGADSVSVTCGVYVEYDVLLREPKLLTESLVLAARHNSVIDNAGTFELVSKTSDHSSASGSKVLGSTFRNKISRR